MQKMKRIVSLLITVVVIMSIVTISADAVAKSKFDYTLRVDEVSGVAVAEITGYRGPSVVKIPARLGKYKVKSISAKAFKGKKSIKSVNFGVSVEEIDESAFQDCTNLNKVVLGDVKFISQNAFKNCSALKSVKIPSSLIGVTGDAFSGCKSLKRFTVEDGNYYYESRGGVLVRKGSPYIVSFPQAKGDTYAVPSDIKGIGSGAFKDNKTIKKVVIRNNVQTIGENAFDGCTNLSKVQIGKSVTQIRAQAFRNCNKLKKVKFSNGLITIDEEAFLGCTKLKSVKLHSKLKNIGDRAFGYMRKDGKYQKIKGVKIIAPINSKAEKYALDNDISLKTK